MCHIESAGSSNKEHLLQYSYSVCIWPTATSGLHMVPPLHVESARNVIGHLGLLMFSPVEIVRTTLGKLKKGTLTFFSSETNYLALIICFAMTSVY